MPELSHLDEEGRLSMVDVGGKEITRREATAEAVVQMSLATLAMVVENRVSKGDVLATAKIAGILAAKRTSDLIPLTHPLAINHVEIRFDPQLETGALVIRTSVRCDGRTGVEIEAMTAASIAALTVYDMCKSAEKGIVIQSIRLLEKSGGKSGLYRAGESPEPSR